MVLCEVKATATVDSMHECPVKQRIDSVFAAISVSKPFLLVVGSHKGMSCEMILEMR